MHKNFQFSYFYNAFYQNNGKKLWWTKINGFRRKVLWCGTAYYPPFPQVGFIGNAYKLSAKNISIIHMHDIIWDKSDRGSSQTFSNRYTLRSPPEDNLANSIGNAYKLSAKNLSSTLIHNIIWDKFDRNCLKNFLQYIHHGHNCILRSWPVRN